MFPFAILGRKAKWAFYSKNNVTHTLLQRQTEYGFEGKGSILFIFTMNVYMKTGTVSFCLILATDLSEDGNLKRIAALMHHLSFLYIDSRRFQ